MSEYRKFVVLTAAVLITLSSCCHADTTGSLPNKVVAATPSPARTDKGINKRNYYKRLEHLKYRDEETGKTMEAGESVTTRLIDEAILLELAEKESVMPTDKQVDERVAQAKREPDFDKTLQRSGYSMDDVRWFMTIEQALFNIQTKNVIVGEAEVRDYYVKNKDSQFIKPERVDVAAIFAKNRADIDKALKMLDGGADFGAVAKKMSCEPNSAKDEGKLPKPVVRGDKNIPLAIQDIIFSVATGKYTQPISDGEGGFAIMKVLKHDKAVVQQFDDVKYTIRQRLMVAEGMQRHIDVKEMAEKFKETPAVKAEIERYKKILTSDK